MGWRWLLLAHRDKTAGIGPGHNDLGRGGLGSRRVLLLDGIANDRNGHRPLDCLGRPYRQDQVGFAGADRQRYRPRRGPHHGPQRLGYGHADPAPLLEAMSREVAWHANLVFLAGNQWRRILMSVTVSQVEHAIGDIPGLAC